MIDLLRFHKMHPDDIPHAVIEESFYDPYGDIGEKHFKITTTFYLSVGDDPVTTNSRGDVSLKACAQKFAPNVHRRFCEAPDSDQAAEESRRFDNWMQRIHEKK